MGDFYLLSLRSFLYNQPVDIPISEYSTAARMTLPKGNNATIDLITHETENCLDLRDRYLEASRWAFDREGRPTQRERGLPAAYREEMDRVDCSESDDDS
jgi:hypothetical protein